MERGTTNSLCVRMPSKSCPTSCVITGNRSRTHPAVPSYYVSRLTRQHVTVALNGDGGDESFAGYDRYLGSLVAERYRRLPAVLRRRLIEPALSLVPESLPAAQSAAAGPPIRVFRGV